jgi:hypothetical protein
VLLAVKNVCGAEETKLELSELSSLLDEIIQAQNNTFQKEAFTKLYQNVSRSPSYMYEY